MSTSHRITLTTAAIIMLLVITQTMNAREIDRSAFARADEAINSAIERAEIPGAVLLAGTDREIVYLKAYGHRAVEPQMLPMKTDTIFDLASLSKPIGCATSI